MIRSLRLRLALGALAAIALSLTAIWYALSVMFADYVSERYRSEMSALVDTIAAHVVFENGQYAIAQEPADPRLSLPVGGRYWQLSSQGQAALRSDSLWDSALGEPSSSSYFGFSHDVGPDGNPVLVFSRELSLAEAKGKNFTVYAAFPEAELSDALTEFRSQLAQMIALTASFLAIAAFLQIFAGLSPLTRLRREIAEIRAGSRSAMSGSGPSETQPLVREINLLLNERENAVERARARASDLAHGLKTPLTVLVHLAQELPPVEKETALKQIDLIRQRADRQLQSARLGVEQMACTRIADITSRLVQVLKPAHAHRSLNWTVLVAPEFVVTTDPADLAEALGNVLENAGKWAAENIVVRANAIDGWTEISVSDDGPGIEDKNFEKVLERGVSMRGESDAGSGLGLAIAADIVNAYGGSLSLSLSDIGGLDVKLRLPSAPVDRLSPA